MTKIDVVDLNYGVCDKRILKSVSLSVEGNKFVGILGPNGSGKTSLLKHIYRVLPVDNEIVLINDEDINSMSYRASSKIITVMKQENHCEFDYTNLEMVLMGRSPRRKFYEKDTAEDLEIARNALKYVGLSDRENDSFMALSGGEKQRVLIARSITQDVDIFLLDEPTNNLDMYYQWNLINLIKKLDKAVIAVLHEVNIALRYCDFVYIMNKGEIYTEGNPDEVITSKMLHDVMRINAEIVSKNGRKSVLVHDVVEKSNLL